MVSEIQVNLVINRGFLWSFSSRCVCALFTATSKVWLGKFNTTFVHGKEEFLRSLDQSPTRGLLTVSNHTSRLDDPMLWSFLPWKHVFNNKSLRWSTAAHDVCFKKDWHATAMLLGKVAPVYRGNGVYQSWMDHYVRQLDSGKWIHIFPEGKINYTKEALRLKWGVGRLISDCVNTPIVIPIHHIGFDQVHPNDKLMLRLGKKASIYIGKPLDLAEETQLLRSQHMTPREMRVHFTNLIQEKMGALKEEAEDFHRTRNR